MNIKNPRKYGKQPYKVAVVHGGPGAAGSLAPLAEKIATKYSVIEPFQTAQTLEGQLEELKIILEKNASFPLTLVGHSWGAMLSYMFCAYYPSLVKKLIIVGSGVFDAKYAKNIMQTRLSRLSKEEQQEFERVLPELNASNLQAESAFHYLGRVSSKADSFDLINSNETEPFSRQFLIYKKVWPQMEKLRADGELLSLGKKISCPVVAIHGDYDPHLSQGIKEPLEGVVKNFRFILLKKCGHYPWIERYAKDEFFDVLLREIGR